jgi:CATRA-Associated Small Protein
VPTTHGADGQHASEDVAIAEAKLAALDVLTDVLQWRLPQARWTRVTEIVQSIDKALSAGDPIALEAATVDLELAGPVRITRVGATPQVPAPQPVRERVNRLVHSLTDDAGTDRGGGDRGKDRGRDQPPNQR